jgi:hypothetical protein
MLPIVGLATPRLPIRVAKVALQRRVIQVEVAEALHFTADGVEQKGGCEGMPNAQSGHGSTSVDGRKVEQQFAPPVRPLE